MAWFIIGPGIACPGRGDVSGHLPGRPGPSAGFDPQPAVRSVAGAVSGSRHTRWRAGIDRSRSGQRGTVAVEFALVAGLMVSMLFIIVDMGLLMTANLVLTQAAREGARRAAIEGGATEGVFERIEAQAAAGRLDLQRLTIEIQPRQAVYGTTIYVNLGYDYRFFTPLLRRLGGDPFALRVEVVTRSEKLDPREE